VLTETWGAPVVFEHPAVVPNGGADGLDGDRAAPGGIRSFGLLGHVEGTESVVPDEFREGEDGRAPDVRRIEDRQPVFGGLGREVIGELAYPGSAMTLIITDPSGAVHQSSISISGPAGKLVLVDIPNAPGGAFKVQVRGDNVNPAEHFTVTMVTKFVCAAKQVTEGGFIRNVLSANDTRDALVQSGASNVSIRFSGASAGGANVEASGSFSGLSFSGAVILYAAGGGNVGVAVTQASLNGIDIKQQITSAIAQAGGRNLDSLSVGYQVDRLYTCSTGKDSFLVMEGRP